MADKVPPFFMSLKSKLPRVGTTIFTVMSKMAADHGALNLSQGFPGFDCDDELKQYVSEAMAAGQNQYAPMAGLPLLRENIAKKTKHLYGYLPDHETEITVTAGATQAIFTAIAAVVEKDDEVIIFEPAYDCYEPAIELFGGITVRIRLDFPSFGVDWEQVKKAITARTKMIVINTPNNPAGSLFSDEDMRVLESLVQEHGLFVLSDEVYEHIVFDGKKHRSVLEFPGIREKAFVVSSFGKTYHTTGWKQGYCVAPAQLMTEFRKVHQYNVFCVNTPVQHALARYLERKDKYEGLGAFYEARRNFFRDRLAGSRFDILPVSGAYFQLLGYSRISNKSDMEFAEELTKTHKIASVPVSAFYAERTDNKVLRFCFAKDEGMLSEAARILSGL